MKIRNLLKKMKKRFIETSERRVGGNPFIMAESVYATPMTPEQKERLRQKISELQ